MHRSRRSMLALFLIMGFGGLLSWLTCVSWFFKSEKQLIAQQGNPRSPHFHSASNQISRADEPHPEKIDEQVRHWLRRDVNGLTIEEHADGRRSLHLDGRFSHVMRLQRTSSGALIPHCLSSAEAWEKNPETPLALPATLLTYER